MYGSKGSVGERKLDDKHVRGRKKGGGGEEDSWTLEHVRGGGSRRAHVIRGKATEGRKWCTIKSMADCSQAVFLFSLAEQL